MDSPDNGKAREEGPRFFLPLLGMVAFALAAGVFVLKSPHAPPDRFSASPGPLPETAPVRSQASNPVPGSPEVGPVVRRPLMFRDSKGEAVGFRILYRDNWEYECPVMGHHILDPEEACFLVAAPARLGPIVVRDASEKVEKPFVTTRDPRVPLVRIKDPLMSLPVYTGPLFVAERRMCSLRPGHWIPSHRPVIDERGRLIRYDKEQVRIFCGTGK